MPTVNEYQFSRYHQKFLANELCVIHSLFKIIPDTSEFHASASRFLYTMLSIIQTEFLVLWPSASYPETK